MWSVPLEMDKCVRVASVNITPSISTSISKDEQDKVRLVDKFGILLRGRRTAVET